MTRPELAERMDVSSDIVCRIERGATDEPVTAELARRAALALRTTTDHLLGLEATEAHSDGMHGSFAEFVRTDAVPPTDARMLVAVRYKGRQPTTLAGWRFLYEAIKRAIELEPVP